MSSETILKIMPDKDPILRLTYKYYSFRFTIRRPILQSLLDLLLDLQSQFTVTQLCEYSNTEIINTQKLLKKISFERDRYYNTTFINGYNSRWIKGENLKSVNGFSNEIRLRLQTVTRERLISSRTSLSILGNFEDSISPKMIQNILTWLKNTNPKESKINDIRRGTSGRMKEQIIMRLKEIGIKIDAMLLSNFIDENNPIEYLKEWHVKSHYNGKRMKNCEIRRLLKIEFYRRERNYLRRSFIKPNIRNLPVSIEKLIFSFLNSDTNVSSDMQVELIAPSTFSMEGSLMTTRAANSSWRLYPNY
mgnify:CR=1 FL=1